MLRQHTTSGNWTDHCIPKIVWCELYHSNPTVNFISKIILHPWINIWILVYSINFLCIPCCFSSLLFYILYLTIYRWASSMFLKLKQLITFSNINKQTHTQLKISHSQFYNWNVNKTGSQFRTFTSISNVACIYNKRVG